MTSPNLNEEAFDALVPAYVTRDAPNAPEIAVLASMLKPLQVMVDLMLDDRGAYASVFDGTITDPRPLRWGAQWAGTDATELTEAQLRDPAYVRRQWRRGSPEAITEAIRSVLTATREVRLYERRDPADFTVDAPYHLSIVTRTPETPGGADSIINAIRDWVPARITVHVSVVDGATWQDVTDAGLTWAALNTAGATWTTLAAGNYT